MRHVKSKGLRIAYELLASVALLALVTLVMACQKEDELRYPFSQLIPSCERGIYTPYPAAGVVGGSLEPWFESTRLGSFHTEQGITKLAERACKGKNLKVWMRIYTFETDLQARDYVRQWPDSYSLTGESDLPRPLAFRPDQLKVRQQRGAEAALLGGGDWELGIHWFSITFRMGRYVGEFMSEAHGPMWISRYEGPVVSSEVDPHPSMLEELAEQTLGQWAQLLGR